MSQEDVNEFCLIGEQYPALKKLIDATLGVWPEHKKYLSKRFQLNDDNFLGRTNELSSLILKLVGADLLSYCQSYRWMCENFIEEDLYFQRHKRYRMSTFDEVNAQVYSNHDYMSRYVQGILLSQVFWHNHALAMDTFRNYFLTSLPQKTSYLEIGPGHGLFLYFAAHAGAIQELTAYDVSNSSIEATEKALNVLGVEKNVALVLQDVTSYVKSQKKYNAIVISEVLEHLENPIEAIKNLYQLLSADGLIYMNIPVNSPAPDHIYLWRKPEEVLDDVRNAGFEIDQYFLYPATGCTVERALKFDLSISCVVIAKKGKNNETDS